MSAKRNYLAGYAVIRIDDGPLMHPAHVQEFELNGVIQPAPGPSNVTVKEVVTTAEEARHEVMRLNALSTGKSCNYYWQSTHIFLDGGSHGSAARAGSENQEEA